MQPTKRWCLFNSGPNTRTGVKIGAKMTYKKVIEHTENTQQRILTYDAG